MMSDKEIMLCLRRLKDSGVKFNYIAENCGIPTKRFYSFTYKRAFPLFEKQQIENYLFSNFKEIVIDECFNR